MGNVEILEVADDRLRAISNFHLSYARPGMSTFLYAGQRRDVLLRTEGAEAPVWPVATKEQIGNL